MAAELAFPPGSSLAYHTGDWRSQQPRYHDKWPPCGQACPASEDIQAWLALASERRWEAAWRKLTERNPLPATMGRVCYHPCELACNRKHLDSAVNIHALERHLGDLALAHGWSHRPLTLSRQRQRVAVVGAGPAGLSCAFQLARRGYPVTIFDAATEAGGTLRSGIPDYRLPKAVLAREIEAILALGIELKLGVRIGGAVAAETLREDFDAVFLAIGAQRPRRYTADASEHGVMTGLDFLHRINRGERPALPRQVAVIGGGNTAIDVARCARRLGAEEVTVVCAQSPHGSQLGQPGAEIPSSQEEIRQAELEGVRLRYGTGVRRLVRSGQHLSGVEAARVDQLHDREGRFAPRLFEGTEEFLPAGLVIFAIGQEVDWQGLESLREAPAVAVGGDAAGEHRFAATAVGSGYRGAMALIGLLAGTPPRQEHHEKAEITYKALHLEYYPRVARREAAVSQRRLDGFDEIVAGLAGDDAGLEAERCLSCGVCFHCDNCWHFCPDAAVIKTADGYRVDYDYCKGCGICAQECPCGHIDMERLTG